jgi:hypothetical protein
MGEAIGKDRTTKLSNLQIKIKRHVEPEGHKTAAKIYDKAPLSVLMKISRQFLHSLKKLSIKSFELFTTL